MSWREGLLRELIEASRPAVEQNTLDDEQREKLAEVIEKAEAWLDSSYLTTSTVPSLQSDRGGCERAVSLWLLAFLVPAAAALASGWFIQTLM